MFLQTNIKNDVGLEEVTARQKDTHTGDSIRLGGKSHTIKNHKIRSCLVDLYLNGERTDRLETSVKTIESEKDLAAHLEKILEIERRAFNELEDLEQAIETFHEAKKYQGDPTHRDAPWNLEGIVKAYSSFGEVELNRLFYLILDTESGGLGYTIKKGGVGLARWEVDHKKKIFTIPQNEFAIPWSNRTNQSAAETLKDAIHEELLNEESLGSKVQRIGSGSLMIAAGTGEVVIGIVGLLTPEPTMTTKVAGSALIALGSSQFTEGLTKIAKPNAMGQGLNPLEEGFAYAGKKVAGEKGEAVARYSFIATNIIVSAGGSAKIGQVLKFEKDLDHFIKTQKLNSARKGHLRQFRDGFSVFMTERPYTDYVVKKGVVGRGDGLFVVPTKNAKALTRAAKKTPGTLEKALGFDKGTFKGAKLVRLDFKFDFSLNPRFPSGLEVGANKYFVWGGYTSGGTPEIVVNPLKHGQWKKIIITEIAK